MFDSTPSFEARSTNDLQDADAHETTPSSTWKITQNRLPGRAAGPLRVRTRGGRAGHARAELARPPACRIPKCQDQARARALLKTETGPGAA